MSTLEKILHWSKTAPTWQQDALRRLLGQQKLHDIDKLEILHILKASFSLPPTGPAVNAVPLSSEHINSATSNARKIVMRKVAQVRGVNALNEDQELKFGHTGITAIYGENGSGKSGYARIFKAACRARDSEAIIGNVFSKSPIAPPSATFVLDIDGVENSISWTKGSKPDELSTVAVLTQNVLASLLMKKTNRHTCHTGHLFSSIWPN